VDNAVDAVDNAVHNAAYLGIVLWIQTASNGS
jgi:hypothetical protein